MGYRDTLTRGLAAWIRLLSNWWMCRNEVVLGRLQNKDIILNHTSQLVWSSYCLEKSSWDVINVLQWKYGGLIQQYSFLWAAHLQLLNFLYSCLLLQHSLHPLSVLCVSLVPQVLDWIENHGEAFLSKHTGVGKSLHRARALQKRHEDFEEVAQVKTITWRTVHLSWKYMKNACSGTVKGWVEEASLQKKSVPRMDYSVSVASFYFISPLCSSFS